MASSKAPSLPPAPPVRAVVPAQPTMGSTTSTSTLPTGAAPHRIAFPAPARPMRASPSEGSEEAKTADTTLRTPAPPASGNLAGLHRAPVSSRRLRGDRPVLVMPASASAAVLTIRGGASPADATTTPADTAGVLISLHRNAEKSVFRHVEEDTVVQQRVHPAMPWDWMRRRVPAYVHEPSLLGPLPAPGPERGLRAATHTEEDLALWLRDFYRDRSSFRSASLFCECRLRQVQVLLDRLCPSTSPNAPARLVSCVALACLAELTLQYRVPGLTMATELLGRVLFRNFERILHGAAEEERKAALRASPSQSTLGGGGVSVPADAGGGRRTSLLDAVGVDEEAAASTPVAASASASVTALGDASASPTVALSRPLPEDRVLEPHASFAGWQALFSKGDFTVGLADRAEVNWASLVWRLATRLVLFHRQARGAARRTAQLLVQDQRARELAMRRELRGDEAVESARHVFTRIPDAGDRVEAVAALYNLLRKEDRSVLGIRLFGEQFLSFPTLQKELDDFVQRRQAERDEQRRKAERAAATIAAITGGAVAFGGGSSAVSSSGGSSSVGSSGGGSGVGGGGGGGGAAGAGVGGGFMSGAGSAASVAGRGSGLGLGFIPEHRSNASTPASVGSPGGRRSPESITPPLQTPDVVGPLDFVVPGRNASSLGRASSMGRGARFGGSGPAPGSAGAGASGGRHSFTSGAGSVVSLGSSTRSLPGRGVDAASASASASAATGSSSVHRPSIVGLPPTPGSPSLDVTSLESTPTTEDVLARGRPASGDGDAEDRSRRPMGVRVVSHEPSPPSTGSDANDRFLAEVRAMEESHSRLTKQTKADSVRIEKMQEQIESLRRQLAAAREAAQRPPNREVGLQCEILGGRAGHASVTEREMGATPDSASSFSSLPRSKSFTAPHSTSPTGGAFAKGSNGSTGSGTGPSPKDGASAASPPPAFPGMTGSLEVGSAVPVGAWFVIPPAPGQTTQPSLVFVPPGAAPPATAVPVTIAPVLGGVVGSDGAVVPVGTAPGSASHGGRGKPPVARTTPGKSRKESRGSGGGTSGAVPAAIVPNPAIKFQGEQGGVTLGVRPHMMPRMGSFGPVFRNTRMRVQRARLLDIAAQEAQARGSQLTPLVLQQIDRLAASAVEAEVRVALDRTTSAAASAATTTVEEGAQFTERKSVAVDLRAGALGAENAEGGERSMAEAREAREAREGQETGERGTKAARGGSTVSRSPFAALVPGRLMELKEDEALDEEALEAIDPAGHSLQPLPKLTLVSTGKAGLTTATTPLSVSTGASGNLTGRASATPRGAFAFDTPDTGGGGGDGVVGGVGVGGGGGGGGTAAAAAAAGGVSGKGGTVPGSGASTLVLDEYQLLTHGQSAPEHAPTVAGFPHFPVAKTTHAFNDLAPPTRKPGTHSVPPALAVHEDADEGPEMSPIAEGNESEDASTETDRVSGGRKRSVATTASPAPLESAAIVAGDSTKDTSSAAAPASGVAALALSSAAASAASALAAAAASSAEPDTAAVVEENPESLRDASVLQELIARAEHFVMAPSEVTAVVVDETGATTLAPPVVRPYSRATSPTALALPPELPKPSMEAAQTRILSGFASSLDDTGHYRPLSFVSGRRGMRGRGGFQLSLDDAAELASSMQNLPPRPGTPSSGLLKGTTLMRQPTGGIWRRRNSAAVPAADELSDHASFDEADERARGEEEGEEEEEDGERESGDAAEKDGVHSAVGVVEGAGVGGSRLSDGGTAASMVSRTTATAGDTARPTIAVPGGREGGGMSGSTSQAALGGAGGIAAALGPAGRSLRRATSMRSESLVSKTASRDTLNEVHTTLASIFEEKNRTDRSDDREGNTRSNFRPFLKKFFSRRYGLRPLAIKQAVYIRKAVATFAAESPRCRIFGFLAHFSECDWRPRLLTDFLCPANAPSALALFTPSQGALAASPLDRSELLRAVSPGFDPTRPTATWNLVDIEAAQPWQADTLTFSVASDFFLWLLERSLEALPSQGGPSNTNKGIKERMGLGSSGAAKSLVRITPTQMGFVLVNLFSSVDVRQTILARIKAAMDTAGLAAWDLDTFLEVVLHAWHMEHLRDIRRLRTLFVFQVNQTVGVGPQLAPPAESSRPASSASSASVTSSSSSSSSPSASSSSASSTSPVPLTVLPFGPEPTLDATGFAALLRVVDREGVVSEEKGRELFDAALAETKRRLARVAGGGPLRSVFTAGDEFWGDEKVASKQKKKGKAKEKGGKGGGGKGAGSARGGGRSGGGRGGGGRRRSRSPRSRGRRSPRADGEDAEGESGEGEEEDGEEGEDGEEDEDVDEAEDVDGSEADDDEDAEEEADEGSDEGRSAGKASPRASKSTGSKGTDVTPPAESVDAATAAWARDLLASVEAKPVVIAGAWVHALLRYRRELTIDFQNRFVHILGSSAGTETTRLLNQLRESHPYRSISEGSVRATVEHVQSQLAFAASHAAAAAAGRTLAVGGEAAGIAASGSARSASEMDGDDGVRGAVSASPPRLQRGAQNERSFRAILQRTSSRRGIMAMASVRNLRPAQEPKIEPPPPTGTDR